MKGALKADGRVLWREVDGEAVLLDPRSGRYFGLEGIGAEVWRRLQSPISPEDLFLSLEADHDAPPADLRRDVAAFLDSLRKEGLCHEMDR